MTTQEMATADGAAMLERVVVGGDLSRLTPKERLHYYTSLCHSLGLNPLTRPFQYLTLNQRLVLYATKDATEQLRKSNGISITKMETERDEDTYTVRVYGKDQTGREDVATGVVAVANIRGEALANAKMKAETKAKRRLTLSIAGLGVLDESEVDDAVIGGRVDVDPDTGEIKSDPSRTDALAATEPGPEPGAPDPAKDAWLGRIGAGFDMLTLTREQQNEVWHAFCGNTMPLSSEPSVRELEELHKHLAAKFKEARGKK